jgi:hypothetical protein
LMPLPWLVTVPDPLPALVTVRAAPGTSTRAVRAGTGRARAGGISSTRPPGRGAGGERNDNLTRRLRNENEDDATLIASDRRPDPDGSALPCAANGTARERPRPAHESRRAGLDAKTPRTADGKVDLSGSGKPGRPLSGAVANHVLRGCRSRASST